MSNKLAIKVLGACKTYRIWDSPSSRLLSPLARAAASVFPKSSRMARSLGSFAAARFKDYVALKDITFEVFKGQAVGIIGRNGSGKSTLLQIIAGTLQQSAGEVETHGRVAALLELGSGFNPDFTGRENALLSAQILGLSRAEIEAKLPDIERFAEIGPFFDQPLRTYSSGMQVRVAFAVHSLLDPAILIVDEALSVGDEFFQRKCLNYIERFLTSGGTLLFTSHSTLLVQELCHSALLLHEGQAAAFGSPRDVAKLYHKSLYGGFRGIDEIRQEGLRLSGKSAPSTDSQAFLAESEMPSLESVRYGNADALISKVRVETKSGRQVNNLFYGERYTIRYEVRFSRRARGVRFGTLVRTIHGIDLAGMTSHPKSGPLPVVEASSHASVSFPFVCQLLPGSYTINAGVTAQDISGDEIYLDRIVDAMLIKVLSDEELCQNSFVALFESANLELA